MHDGRAAAAAAVDGDGGVRSSISDRPSTTVSVACRSASVEEVTQFARQDVISPAIRAVSADDAARSGRNLPWLRRRRQIGSNAFPCILLWRLLGAANNLAATYGAKPCVDCPASKQPD